MFASLLLKLKSFIPGNLSSMFIVGLLALLGIIVLFNADTVLSKFGMETRSTLSAKVAKTEQQLKEAERINEELNATIATLRLASQTQVTAVETNCETVQQITETVLTTQSSLDQSAQAIKKAPRKPSAASKPTDSTQGAQSANTSSEDVLVLQMTNNLSPEQLNALSENNITAINSSFAELFKKV